MRYFATLKEKVIDGTICTRPLLYFKRNVERAVCVDGICKVSRYFKNIRIRIGNFYHQGKDFFMLVLALPLIIDYYLFVSPKRSTKYQNLICIIRRSLELSIHRDSAKCLLGCEQKLSLQRAESCEWFWYDTKSDLDIINS